ncbi:RNA polymerase-associated protein RapA [Rheinheimera sp. F8]|nr:RNA polymerase-associated protein RapA [Rheinheimera sp. F8]ALZ75474.1 RNA polymerase-associated protein RapA [Rheinheimera sp. F8]ALZ77496.1 RNA polymerase-associated protein RapA [Rheinheimera sp. F8]
MKFALGQRWISDAESDLGLGTVVGIDGRMVTMLFPASGETRLYAMSEAPLTRVQFNPGDTVKSAQEFSLVIERIEEVNQTLVYHGERTDTGEAVSLRETFLDHFISFSSPQDRLFTGQIDRFDWFTLRYHSWQHLHQQQQNPQRGLVGGRLSLIPHQLHIANEVSQRHAPRVLLSDEVGLGKTIEAGLIIHQQLLSGLASRVLIVVPESLQHQWLVEMLRRFNLKFAIFDDERLTEATADGGNPFETEQLVLLSLDFLTRKKAAFEAAAETHWDLLVVDEAHHLTWSEAAASTEYQRIETLAQDTPGVILLTATPDQLGHQSHFARLRLLDPNRFYDYQAFVAEEQQYKAIATLARALQQEAPLSGDTAAQLQQLLQETDISAHLSLLKSADTGSERDAAIDALLSLLLDHHGTGRILFRNTRAAIAGFPQRQPQFIGLPLPEQYQNAIKVQLSFMANQTDEFKAKTLLFPERIYQEFEGSKTSWWQFDPRVEAVIALIKQHKYKKFLVICAHADIAIALEEAMRVKEGIRAAVFHEGMSIFDRDKAAAYFAQDDQSAQALICSEIGSEGRNFQFAHHLVLFDLPLNPDLLEQRIGRLDRIGQTQDIQIHLPYFIDQPQQVLLDWYHQGLGAFDATCQTGGAVYQQMRERLLPLLAQSTPDPAAVSNLLADSREMNLQLKQQLEQGRDQLLELNSSGRGQAQQLVEQVRLQDDATILPLYMLKAWDLLGVQQDDRSDTSIVLTPSEHLQGHYPMLDEDGITVTFDRATALAQEDIQFLSWDHPMVQGTLDIVTQDTMGNSAAALLHNKQLPAATFFVECIYLVEASAPAELQLGRYLPPTPIRLLLEKTGKNLAPNVPFDNFNRQLKPVGRQTASKLVGALQSTIHPLLAKAEAYADVQLKQLQQEALRNMHNQLQAQQDRLQALAKINPLVRPEEIAHLADKQQQLDQYIGKARLRFDAIRVIVVSHD